MITIRELGERDEFDAAVDLQRSIWNFADTEVIPVRMFIVAGKIGGQILGAFDGDKLVAFLLAVPGIRQGGQDCRQSLNYLHSHMLGVLPEYRDQGLGRRLKLRQREDALSRGIDLIEWTFDPLEPRNAFFNIERLGVIVQRYVENQYGRTSSALHAGLPTDRFVAEWWLDSERVRSLLAGEKHRPVEPSGRVQLPANIGNLKASDSAAARAVQQRLAGECLDAFARGQAVTGFERTEENFEYLFTPWH